MYQIDLPTQTPFTAHPGARRRVARACAHIERQTSKGLSELEMSDSGAEDEDEDPDMTRRTDRTVKAQAKAKVQPAAPSPAPAPPPPPGPPPPVFAAPVRDPWEGQYDPEEGRRAVDNDDDSEDEFWDVGQTWFTPLVVEDAWSDSEEEV